MNQTIITGNLGGDPELRYTASGVPVCAFNVAVNKKWTDPEGEPKEKTTWFRVSVWRGQAEACEKHLEKGSRVMVIGEIEAPKIYNNRDGEPATSLELTAASVEFLSTRSEGAGAHRQQPPTQERRKADKDIPF